MPPSTPKPAKAILRTAVATRTASPAASRPTTSKFKLTSPATFLSHNKIGSSPTVRVAEPVVSEPQPNIGNGILVPPPPSSLAPQGGLAASRWAASPAPLVDTSEPENPDQPATHVMSTSISEPVRSVQIGTPAVDMKTSGSTHSVRSVITAISTNASDSNHSVRSATVAPPLTIVTNGVAFHPAPINIRTVVDERTVKIHKNNGDIKIGTARLVKSDERSALTLELQVDGDIVLSELLTDTASLKADANFVTYRADPTNESRPTWKLQFQLPGPAKGFVNYHDFRLAEMRRSGCSSYSSEQGKQNSLVLISSAPSSPVPSAFSNASNTTSCNDASYFANRISSSTFADLAELNGQETLFSLYEEEETKPEDTQAGGYSTIQDLLSLVEEDIIDGTLRVLNVKHGGSFFDHVAQLAKGTGLENDADFMKHAKNVFVGGLSSSRYSNSKPILSITEELVADFFKQSPTMQRFPRESHETYIKAISKKILNKAQNPDHVTQSTTLDGTKSSNNGEIIERVEVPEVIEVVKAIENVKVVAPVNVAPSKAVEPVQLTENIKPTGISDIVSRKQRITYSIEELMNMRPGATITSEVFAARDSLVKYLPSKSRQPQYKDSLRATATKLQPSEWKTRFASTPSNQEVSQAIEQDQTAELQILEQANTPTTASSINNTTTRIPSKVHDRQDSFDEENGTLFSKLSPAEWKAKFSGIPKISTDLNAAIVKESPSITGNHNEIAKRDTLVSLSVDNKAQKAPAETFDHHVPDESNGTSFVTPKTSTCDVLKKLAEAEQGEVEVKAESEGDTSPLKLPSNRGLSTSRYATPEVVSQAAVLRASSGYKYPVCQVGKQQDSSNRSSGSSTPLRSTQVHDTALWETLLSSKQRPSFIKVESPELPKIEPEAITLTSELEKSMPMTPKSVSDVNLAPRSKHTATNSDIDRLAQSLESLDVKTENSIEKVAEVLPTTERSTSPTLEELLQKKRVNGLATSKWASPQAPIFKPAPRTPQSTPTSYSQLNSNMARNDEVFSPQNGYHNPAMQPHSPYGDFSQYGSQYSVPQVQVSNGYFSPEVNDQYPVMSTVLVTDPNTGNFTEVTGVAVRPLAPVISPMPPAYMQHIPPSTTGFVSSGSFQFPPRPTMLEKSFSDTDSEDLKLKATAPVFTPSRPRDGNNMTRPALSPVHNRQNAQQEAVQARLNKSLAEKRI